jgi:hypothetical protein
MNDTKYIGLDVHQATGHPGGPGRLLRECPAKTRPPIYSRNITLSARVGGGAIGRSACGLSPILLSWVETLPTIGPAIRRV